MHLPCCSCFILTVDNTSKVCPKSCSGHGLGPFVATPSFARPAAFSARNWKSSRDSGSLRDDIDLLSSYEVISHSDLPISLDDPVAAVIESVPDAFARKRRSILDHFPRRLSFRPGQRTKRKQIDRHWKYFLTVRLPRFFRTKSKDDKACCPSPSSGAQTLVNEVLYELVSPHELTASPLLGTGLDFLPTSARNSFAPPDPDWLSRNVEDCPKPPETQPDSPAAIPIPPRILVTSHSTDSSLLSPLEGTVDWFDGPGEHPQPSSVSRNPSTESPPVIKLDSFSKTIPLLFEKQPTHIQHSDTRPSKHPELVPPQLLHQYSENQNPAPLTGEFWKLLLGDINNKFTSMAYTGKRTDIVDFGGEFDYSDVEWFRDPPSRPPPPQTQTQPATPYVPLPGVIEQNEAYEFALSAAPNVLYGRYKQYGQLGVLAWCSEFSELIDGLKELGFQGNMFVSTRTQALRTCEGLLKLELIREIEMQIIIMYLCSQVARLRRFLDGDRNWDDYPEPNFPLEPRQYT